MKTSLTLEELRAKAFKEAVLFCKADEKLDEVLAFEKWHGEAFIKAHRSRVLHFDRWSEILWEIREREKAALSK